MKQDNELDKEDIEFNENTTDLLKQKHDDLLNQKLELEQKDKEATKKILELDQKHNDLIKQRDAITRYFYLNYN